MTTAFVGFGANQGDPARVYEVVANDFSQHPAIEDVRRSQLYRTTPVGGPENQDTYSNGAYELVTSMSARELLDFSNLLEERYGRVRAERWGPRPIDLDLLLFGNQTVQSRQLSVPHPRMHYRRFVLEPLVDLDPEVVHPVLEMSVAEIFRSFETTNKKILLLGGPPSLADRIRRDHPGRSIVHCPLENILLDMRKIGQWVVGTVWPREQSNRFGLEEGLTWSVLVETPPASSESTFEDGLLVPTADCRAKSESEIAGNIGFFFDSLNPSSCGLA